MMEHTPRHQDLGHGITILDAEYIQPGVAAVYLMQQGQQVAIIETGTAYTVPYILELLSLRGLGPEDVAYVIPTHVHLDHAGGAGELMAQCPQAQLVIHPFGARHMIEPDKLRLGVIAVYGEEAFTKYYGELKPIDASRVIEAGDGFELDFNGRKLLFIDTPGHAKHHFCLYDATSQGIFTGDTYGLSYPQLITEQGPFILATTTPVQFDPDALIQSIDRLLSLQPAQMFLTHYGVVVPTPALTAQLKETIRNFTQIALEEKNNQLNRQSCIETRLMDYLTEKLRVMQCHLPEPLCREVLQNDVILNAQGLDVWLSRQTD